MFAKNKPIQSANSARFSHYIMKTLLPFLSLVVLFTACEKTTVAPPAAPGNDTTIIVPATAPEEKTENKTETNTTIVNPPASEEKTETTETKTETTTNP